MENFNHSLRAFHANAVAERINGVLKQEFLLEEYNFPLDVMREIIKDVVLIYTKFKAKYTIKFILH